MKSHTVDEMIKLAYEAARTLRGKVLARIDARTNRWAHGSPYTGGSVPLCKAEAEVLYSIARNLKLPTVLQRLSKYTPHHHLVYLNLGEAETIARALKPLV